MIEAFEDLLIDVELCILTHRHGNVHYSVQGSLDCHILVYVLFACDA